MSDEYDRGFQDGKNGKDASPPGAGGIIGAFVDILPESGSMLEAVEDYQRGYDDGCNECN